jgi:methyl-accepting chemotaxis protein
MFFLRNLSSRLKIGSRIAVSVIVLLLLVVAVVGGYGYAQQRELSAQTVSIKLNSAYERVLEELKARERIATALAQSIANYPGLAERLDKFDRAWLLENIMPLHRIARDQYGFTYLSVFKPPAINMLRWHDPTDPAGNDLSNRRITVFQALATGQLQAGLEQARYTLAMFAVVPIRIGDRIIGAVDVGTAILPPLAEDLKKRLGIDIAFHVFADDKFETVAGTIPDKSLLSVEDRKAGMSNHLDPRDVRIGEKYLAATAMPLVNFANKPIGVIEIALDVTDMVTRSQHSLYLFMTAASMAVLLGLIVSLLLARRIGRPIREITGAMRGLADGHLDLTVPHGSRRDEIGVMAGALEIFRKGLLERRNLEDESASQRKQAEELCQRNDEERHRTDEHRLTLERGAAKTAEEQALAMKALTAGLASLAEGDLTVRMTEGFAESYRQIKDDFNMTIERLHETIQALTGATREVSSASAEISTSTTDLSQRTEEQAASLEQTSASMEEISATVKKNAENAQAANTSASGTRTVADRGGQVVAKAVDAMAKIEDSSRKISDIIGVIDEIARQTNLLALNAAVEAARAGEAGRGFAVVASEVRSLAQRSSQAAKDIKDLITNSNGQVKDGVELVNRAGTALTEIVESIKKVSDIVADIANASGEQASGIEQVNKALTQMDEVTQQNSALVEENAATAKTLEHQAKTMNERVAFFRIDAAAKGGHTAQPANAREQRAGAAVPMRKPVAPKKQPVVAPKWAAAGGNSGGPVGRMQAALATAVKTDPDWKEF